MTFHTYNKGHMMRVKALLATTILVGVTALGLGGCKPAPTLKQVLASPKTSKMMTWQCPSGGDRPLYMNDVGYRDLSPAFRAKCHKITPTHL